MHNFKAFNTPIVIDNPDSKNILLYGENGSGKTSIFDAIRFVFYHDRILNADVDKMLPANEQLAIKNANKSKFNNTNNGVDFSIKVNDNDWDAINTEDYKVFCLNRFDKCDSISLTDVLSHSDTPLTNINGFLHDKDEWQMIQDYVNLELKGSFHEMYEISVGLDYRITIKDTETGLSRDSELSIFFNEATINLVQLLIWFTSIQEQLDNSKKNILLLDDFMTSLDAANRTHMLRYVFRTFKSSQVIILTHDYTLFNIASYIINEIDRVHDKWLFLKLYVAGNERCLEEQNNINVDKLKEEYNSNDCDYDILGNKVRKCFEQRLHDLASTLCIGNTEETKDIIDRIGQSKSIYWKNKSSLQNLIADIDAMIPSISNPMIRNKINKEIEGYRIPNAGILKETINSLKLYQKIAMHPLSHGVLGVPHYNRSEVWDSIILLEKLDKCVKSIIDGKI